MKIHTMPLQQRHTTSWARCLFLLFLMMTSCRGAEKRPSEATRTVTDMAGRVMVVPDTIRTVFVNRPGSILLYALAPDMLVNRSFDFSPEAAAFLKKEYLQLPYAGNSAEEVMRLKPDIIISAYTIDAGTIDAADLLSRQTGIPVYQVSFDMDDYPDMFRRLGNLLGRQQQAQRMLAFMDSWLKPVRLMAASLPERERKRIYYAEGSNGLFTSPAGSEHSRIIDLVGGINVARLESVPHRGMSQVSMEHLLDWNPEIILVWTNQSRSLETMQHILHDPLWQNIQAVKKGAVHQIPFLPYGWFDRPPGTNRILGVLWTAHVLYPEHCHFDMQKVTKEYFRIFYHRELDDAEAERVLLMNSRD